MKQRRGIGIIAALGAFAAATPVYAAPHCSPTARVPTSHYPGAQVIPPSNNLLLPSGKSVPIEGQRLVVTGHILDKNCMPVTEAVVELWQTDPFGHWYLAEDGDRVNPRPTFAGAGRTITDMDGAFSFITAFPGAPVLGGVKDKNAIRAPHLNLRIKAKDFTPVTTVVFFEKDRRNAGDPAYAKVSLERRSGVTLSMAQGEDGDLNGTITIVLAGSTPYRTY